MAPLSHNRTEYDHNALLEKLDMFRVRKPFRNPNWKPPQRRNKNIKQIISEAQRKEASVMATQNNSGSSTPAVNLGMNNGGTGAGTPANGANANIAQAAQNLSAMVAKGGNVSNGPAVTYTNVEAPPSLQVKRKYCDITGLPSKYTDPKTRLRYHNSEVFGIIRTMGQSVTENYLAARGAHTVLK
ncbi:YL1 nuclear protein C-terminal domain-containing protein [Phyllosticta citribraziliensis]|uniref:YL1 nuclear protein C-terminal domain-containing protein n=1 Tax=Phyllosticta citribraziliensis TaxID=989973 RepID=A0ABR1MB38_9PEZI